MRGGAREGAGRKSKFHTHQTVIAKAEKQICDRLPELVDAQIDLALGVTVQEIDKEGNVNIYTRAPDRAALEYCINRILGKPTERVEADIEGDLGITIKVVRDRTELPDSP